MHIVIYNINSFGGNYEYSKALFESYRKNNNVISCTLLMPTNAEIKGEGILNILMSDAPNTSIKLFRKLHFVYRSLINPFRLFKFLMTQEPSFVIFNDFDQLTAWFWAFLFHFMKKRHQFSVILHDPDRDKFFPVKFLSESSMNQVMSFMDIGFYHGFLPEKKYYKGNFTKIMVPHGIYTHVKVDHETLSEINKNREGFALIGVLGNIRQEKNYEVIIDSLGKMDKVKLLIAGKEANSGVSINHYKQYAVDKNVADRIIWMEGYLSTESFNAAISACDIVLLYYKPTFTSQSGVLNTIAPFGKKLIISDAESSLKLCVEQYNLAFIIPHDAPEILAKGILELLSYPNNYNSANWENYIKDSSWDRHVAIALDSFKNHTNGR